MSKPHCKTCTCRLSKVEAALPKVPTIDPNDWWVADFRAVRPSSENARVAYVMWLSGSSHRAIARELGVSRGSVAKMCEKVDQRVRAYVCAHERLLWRMLPTEWAVRADRHRETPIEGETW